MGLAWKELIHEKKKYILIELVIILLMFMVLFLSGLVGGMDRAIISGIANTDADYFLLSDSAGKLITTSSLDSEIYEELKSQTDLEIAVLDIQRTHLSKKGDAEKLDVAYFAIEAGSFLEPTVKRGVQLSQSDAVNPIVLDNKFASEGIQIGDKVCDSASGLEFTVIGFVKDRLYVHTPAAFITVDAFTEICTQQNPLYEKAYHTIAIKGSVANIRFDGTELVSKADVIQNIPSYRASHLTITVVEWVLVVITAAIIGVFYYVLTIQKRKQFGVMKAIGTGMGRLSAVVAGQVGIISACGAVIANVLTWGISAALPDAIPFFLKITSVCLVTAAFIFISLASSLLSILIISRIDPMKAIGGGEE